MKAFPDRLKAIASRFASKKALADAVGVSQGRLSRALKGDDNYSFNVENCLRLADVSGEPASEILRAAGKADVADLLERLYGGARPATLPAEERELLTRWRFLSPDAKENLKGLIWRLSERATRAKRPA